MGSTERSALRRAALTMWVIFGLVLGADSAVAAPAPVPCSAVGGGKYECSWWRPGDGRSGGAMVVDKNSLVGYLHQGGNWITCQKQGADVYNEDGNKNNWYGWTQSDYGGAGWASALDAKGGDDYGKFRDVPDCRDQHGSAPSVEGRWDTTPPGGTVPRPDNRTEGDGRPTPPSYPYPERSRVDEGDRASIPDGVDNPLQCAFGPFWPEAKFTGNPGVRYCWRYGGNRIYVKDTLADRAAAVVYYSYTKHDAVGADRDGYCINSHGTGTWATCMLKVRGQKRKIKLYGAVLDRDRNHRARGMWCKREYYGYKWPSKCSKEHSLSGDTVTTHRGIECPFAHKGGDRCQELTGNKADPQPDEKPR